MKHRLRLQLRAEFIRQQRADGLTLTSVAESCGVPRPNLSRYFAGRKSINVETIERIAAALGMELNLRRRRDNGAAKTEKDAPVP